MDIGNVSITAPANGSIHILLTGNAYMRNNNTVLLGIGTFSSGVNLDYAYGGVFSGGSGTEDTRYSLNAQAVTNATQGITYTFYATTYRSFDDHQRIQMTNVKLTAIFYATS
jgi:hypothetical protein